MREKWLEEPDIHNPPKKRMNHSASIMGCIMMVHGGFSTEAKQVLDDYQLFDIEAMQWIDTRIFINQ